MLERIEVFKAGKHRAIDGNVYAFSEADVAQIAASYAPAVQAAPVVIGHPKADNPAFGWVKGLSVENGVLMADLEKVNPAFAEGVDGGSYRYVSSKFYAPSDPSNPAPGNWYLRHVGYLGAQPPAVKGLQPAFSDASDEGVAFAEINASIVKDLFRRWRDWLIEDKGLDYADNIIPAWYLDSIEVQASPGFAEGGDDTTTAAGDDTLTAPTGDDTLSGGSGADVAFAERISELDARDANITAREAAFAEGERTRHRDEDGAYLDGLVTAGRLPPGFRAGVAAVFARLDGDQSVAFAEADAEPRAELRKILDGLGVAIRFDELAGDGPAFAETQTADGFASAIGRVQAEAAAQGRHLSAAEAARIVRNT